MIPILNNSQIDRERLLENKLIPYEATKIIKSHCVLVLAPHPDDEVFGCGGAIMRHVEQRIPVHVVIATDGAFGVSQESKSDYIQQRQLESILAAVKMGCGAPDFWSYPDRALCYGEKLVTEILTKIEKTGADLVYAPSIHEAHPDHRALAMAAIEAVRRSEDLQLALYEIGQPIQPNLLLDISDIATRKMEAMSCFTSQNAKQRYDLDIAALNRYRTYTLPAEVTAAEAYILTDSKALTDDPLKLHQSVHTRQEKLGLTLDTRALPLVSVIIRSMGRTTLSEALDSIALQTYSNIEIVLVDAKGTAEDLAGGWCGRFPIQKFSTGHPLKRSAAANLGLDSAIGDYLIFLDDDDTLYAEHISNLVTALQNNYYRCAYSGIKVEHYINGKLEASSVFNESFDQRRLLGRNFIPIHAVLFNRSLLRDGCRFDEDLDFFEDWDFWMQISQHTPILHVNKIGGVYRNHGASGLGLKQDKSQMRKLRSKLFNKWKTILTGEQLDDLIQYREDAITDLNTQLKDLNTQLKDLNNQLIDSNKQNTVLNSQLIDKQKESIELHNDLTQKKKFIGSLQAQQEALSLAASAREASLHKTINDLTSSTSWRITGPLRLFSRIARGQHREALASIRRRTAPILKSIYWQLPKRLRENLLTLAYRFAGPVFSGMGHYEIWRANKNFSSQHVHTYTTGNLAEMVNISNFPILKSQAPGRIAIHAHLYYPDLATEFAKYFRNMPFPYDLFVSVPHEEAHKKCEEAFSSLPLLGKLNITISPNRGRDIGPMLCTFGNVLTEYDFIAHIHSKKSLYNNGATDGWREYLLDNLFGSKSQIGRIFTLLTGETHAGIVYPQNFSGLPYSAYTWLSNQHHGRIWCNKLGIKDFPTGYFDFPAGSMFWAKTNALRPLFEAGIKIEDFPEESGQNDATLAHCLERLFALTARRTGFNALVLKDASSNSWSRWRFDQYLARSKESTCATLDDPAIRIIIFDIFDTLLVRPLFNPESIKTIVAQRAGESLGKIYIETRAIAETQARQKAGKDIGLDAIFEEMAHITGLKPEMINQLRQLEESVEIAAVTPRPEAINLLKFAATLNKRILLASDMYLSKSIIETMLANNGIAGWHQLYVSSNIGLRKDTGDLYHHILKQEQVSPDEIVMIGDNEHSDLHKPLHIGINANHILRPIEMARAIPRLGQLVEKFQYQNNLDTQLSLGLIIRENFQPLYYPNFDPSDFVPASPWAIGYTVVGPLILSFIQWLIKKATADGIENLYFLSREGQILKEVYDLWTEGTTDAIPSNYLILSRRAITVPMISSFNDILEIARTRYFSNHITNFIEERYGLTLSETECSAFVQQKILPTNQLISVENKEIDHLLPILQALKGQILDNAKYERPGLLAYLNNAGLDNASSPAIVDIGYAGTIQGRLNRLLNKAIHGYYLVTEENAKKVSSQHGVIAEGCFSHHTNPTKNVPLILRESFSLEKLLSSDDAQIVRYHLNKTGQINPEFRELAQEELQTKAIRAEIQRGIMEFVNQSILIREKLSPDFTVPPDLATALYETFIQHPSKAEQEILSKITLDDYYCGRGLVS